jgi:glutamate---cysteine ligase / carboxylate-amine ligase
VVDEEGTVLPVRQAILDLVEDLTPTAKRLGCEAELLDVERVLAVGASYQRQRAVAAASGGNLRPVVDSLLAEMRDGLPTHPEPSGLASAGPVPGPADCAGGPAA